MVGSHEQNVRELELERLLGELLGEQTLAAGGISGDPCPETLELLDMARRLRGAAQGVVLAEGGLLQFPLVGAGQRAHRRLLGWSAVVAAAVLVVISLGVGWAWIPTTPSSPWYDAGLAVENLRIALLPSPMAKAERLVATAHARIAEVEVAATADDAEGLRRAARALDSETEWLHKIVTTLPVAERKQIDRALEQL